VNFFFCFLLPFPPFQTVWPGLDLVCPLCGPQRWFIVGFPFNSSPPHSVWSRGNFFPPFVSSPPKMCPGPPPPRLFFFLYGPSFSKLYFPIGRFQFLSLLFSPTTQRFNNSRGGPSRKPRVTGSSRYLFLASECSSGMRRKYTLFPPSPEITFSPLLVLFPVPWVWYFNLWVRARHRGSPLLPTPPPLARAVPSLALAPQRPLP